LDCRLEKLQNLAHVLLWLNGQVLSRKLAQCENIGTLDNPQKEFGVWNTELPHVCRERGVQLWEFVVEL
jgi:hypothetical protein